LLQRNLLYTTVTRAKRLVVLVGSKRAIGRAVRTEGAGRPYAALAEPPEAFLALLRGEHIGKMVVRVGPDPACTVPITPEILSILPPLAADPG
jgi:hypothetical protein